MSPKPGFLSSLAVPQQKRSQRTRKRLVKAAMRLFAERGYDATSTSQIAKRAGMSAGLFYRYFKDKRDIFQEIYNDHSFAGAQAFMAELDPDKWRNEGMRAIIKPLVETVYTIHKANPRLQGEFAQIELRDAEFLEERERIHSLVQKRLEDLLEDHRDELHVTNIPVAACLIKEAVEACIHRNFRSNNRFDEEELKEQLIKMVINYLIHSDD
jgi:AcrR family transcriptional regulator